MRYSRTLAGLALIPFLALSVPAGAQVKQPRLLVLPWLVIDRNTNRECSRPEGSGAEGKEAQRIGASAQAALDAEMHGQKTLAMIPRKEWQPQWSSLANNRVLWKGAGCAVCTPAGELIRYDRALVQQIAQAVQADYVWLGVTALPLTPGKGSPAPDDCCRDALAQGRRGILARSSVLLVRAQDGEVIWQRDARRLEQDVPHRAGKIVHPPSLRRTFAVDATAHLLGKAFRREQREALR